MEGTIQLDLVRYQYNNGSNLVLVTSHQLSFLYLETRKRLDSSAAELNHLILVNQPPLILTSHV